MDTGAALFQEHLLTRETVDGAVWHHNPLYPKPRHFHSQVEIIVVIRGRVVERVGNRTHAAHAGQLIWHLPGIHHHQVEATRDLDLRVLHTEPDLSMRLFPELGFESAHKDGSEPGSFSAWTGCLAGMVAGRPVVELKQRDRDRILDECEVDSVDIPTAEEAGARVRRALLNAWQATQADHDDRRPHSLVELASCQLLEKPGLERSTICRELDVSEGYLSRRFKAELGISFLQHRSRIRVARFVTHVVREHRSLHEAALLAGFGSYSQLHRVFTNLVGTNPRAYLFGGERNVRANQETLGG